MLRRLAFAGLIALFPAVASAQFATIGPTPAVTDSGDRLATTQWVNNLIANGLTLASGKIWIGSAGNIATPQTPSGDCTLSLSGVITCTQSAGNFLVNGTLTVSSAIIDGNGILATNIVAPATPAAGTTRIYVDSTQKVLTFKNDAGVVGIAVVPSTCTTNQFGVSVSAAGVFGCAQPAIANISGWGTGVATALGVNIGSAGGPVVNGGALGTPSSGSGANLTALSASNISTGTLALARLPSCPPSATYLTTGSGTYTTPTCGGVLPSYIDLKETGAGAGGGGGNNATPGGNGGNTCWNTTGAACTSPVYQAGGGTGGVDNGASSAGGTISGSGTCNYLSVGGGSGLPGTNTLNVATTPAVSYPGLGGAGGNSSLGGSGGGGNGGTSGGAGATNSGSGGGGGGTTSSAANGTASGSGGGAGGTCGTIITSPASSYTYAVGALGSGAAAGTNGAAGGNGTSGTIAAIAHWY